MSAKWNPSDYASNSGAQAKWAAELMEKLPLNGDERILDLGCGDGKITVLLAEQVPRGSVLGVDHSAEMIEFALNSHTANLSNIAFQVADAAALDLPPEFDRVFSNAALHWVPDHPAVLRGVAASLKSGGRLLFQMGGRGNVDDVSAIMQTLITDARWSPYFNDLGSTYFFFGPDEYERWLPEAGLRPLRCELIPKVMTHTPEKFTGWLRTTWLRYTERVPEDRREDFIAECVRNYIEAFPPDAEGNVHVKMVRLEVEAVKNT